MNKETQTDLRTISIVAAGNADWLSKVVIPFHSELSVVMPQRSGEIPLPLRQRLTRSEPQIMNAWGTVLAVGLAIYIPIRKLVDKALEEGYEVILKPRIRKMWEGLEKTLIRGNQKCKKAFLFGVWYEEYNVLVTVSVLGNSLDDIVEQLDAIYQIHLNALSRIKTIGVSAPVHHYLLQEGKVNAEPQLFEREEDIVKRIVSDVAE